MENRTVVKKESDDSFFMEYIVCHEMIRSVLLILMNKSNHVLIRARLNLNELLERVKGYSASLSSGIELLPSPPVETL
jgi:hypothetical protein